MLKILTVLSICMHGALFAAKTQVTEVIMGFNPAENVAATEMQGKKFSDYFEKKMGIKVKTFIATDYSVLIEALRSGRIHFAWFPPFSYVQAERIADAQVLLKAIRKGRAFTYSAIIARTDKNINSIEDLKGKSIAWVDPSSASGHIFPKASIYKTLKSNEALQKKLGIKIEKVEDLDKVFFGKQIFAGSHDALVIAVVNGRVDAGATFTNDADGEDSSWRMFIKNPEDQKKVKLIHVSDPIPADNLATSKKFLTEHKDLVEKTVQLVSQMHQEPEGKQILHDLYRIESMVPATSQDYQPVREAAQILKVSK